MQATHTRRRSRFGAAVANGWGLMLTTPSRVTRAFGALILTQAAHSIEEYAGRLWESFPPARWLTGLVSPDRELAFITLNVALVAFGLWCLLWPVRRGWPSAAALVWGWIAVEAMNGVGHLLWSLREGGYTPGAGTAPALVVAAIYLARQMRRSPTTPPAAV